MIQEILRRSGYFSDENVNENRILDWYTRYVISWNILDVTIIFINRRHEYSVILLQWFDVFYLVIILLDNYNENPLKKLLFAIELLIKNHTFYSKDR